MQSGGWVTEALMGAQIAGGIGSAIGGYFTNNVMMEGQKFMALEQGKHADKLGQIDRDTKLGQLGAQEEQQQIVADGSAQYNRAVEERKQAEDGQKIMDAKIAQLKLNERAGRLRDRHFYGAPAAI